MSRFSKLHLLVVLAVIMLAVAATSAGGAVSRTLAQSTAASTMAATASPVTSTVTIAKGKTIKIGWGGDESLQLIKPSLGIQYGAQIAINRFNAKGGVQGFQVELVSLDDQCKGDQATTVAQKFASTPDLVGVVGHVCSGATIPASDVYEKARIVMVSASATANSVTNRGLTVVNRVAFNDDNQALADSQYIYNELKATKLAILDDGQSYGKGLGDALSAAFTKLGGTVVDDESIDPQAKDYRSVLTKLLATPPDVLFFGGYENPAALLTQQMKEVGLTKTQFYSDDGAYTTTYLQLAGKDAEGVITSSVAIEPDAAAIKDFSAEFEKTFNVKYGDYDPYQPNGYDAASMILDALTKTATVDAQGNLVIDREALIKAVRGTKDFKGLTGTLTCDPKGECAAGSVNVNIAKNGAWQTVKTYTGADLAGTSASATMAPTMSGTVSADMTGTMAATAASK